MPNKQLFEIVKKELVSLIRKKVTEKLFYTLWMKME